MLIEWIVGLTAAGTVGGPAAAILWKKHKAPAAAEEQLAAEYKRGWDEALLEVEKTKVEQPSLNLREQSRFVRKACAFCGHECLACHGVKTQEARPDPEPEPEDDGPIRSGRTPKKVFEKGRKVVGKRR